MYGRGPPTGGGEVGGGFPARPYAHDHPRASDDVNPVAMRLTVPEPCHQDWTAMPPRERGRYCGACAKAVVDFSGLSDAEILDLLAGASGTVCARVRAAQLNRTLRTGGPAPAPPHGGHSPVPPRRTPVRRSVRTLARVAASALAGLGAMTGYAQADSLPGPLPPPLPDSNRSVPGADIPLMGFVVPARLPRTVEQYPDDPSAPPDTTHLPRPAPDPAEPPTGGAYLRGRIRPESAPDDPAVAPAPGGS